MDQRRRRDSYDSDPETNNNEGNGLSKSELSRQIDKLNRDLQRRDRELEEERQENLRALERIKKLERDKAELRREIEDFRDEANEYKKAFEEFKHKRKPGDEDLKEKYEVALQQKNHEIRQLLDDIEKLEGEKNDLQGKLNELKESLQDATAHLESMTQEHVTMKGRLGKSEGKIKELQDDKVILEIKLKDLLSFKQRHDQYLENLCSAVDVRVDVWKKMMFQKDEEIDRLNVKLATLANQIPSGQLESDKGTVNQLKMKLLERESTIATLSEKLAQATQDLESATEHINALNSKLKNSTAHSEMGAALESLQLKANKYKSQLERKDEQVIQLEREVEEKSRELTSLAARMHAYETGVYGLSEAIGEIKELKTQIRIRNNQIETQTQEINALNLRFNDIVDENDLLREKLGILGTADLTEETQKFSESKRREVMQLKGKITSLEEEVVQLKSKNYTYRKQLQVQTQTPQQHHPQPQQQVAPTAKLHVPLTPAPTAPPEEFGKNLAANFNETEWKEKYEIILGENIELRKGLQEILETMQRMTDEGSSDVLIDCPILETLLREMSARGLIHYPYGISSFHLKVCNLEGKNTQLREEIHRLKQEEKQNRAELIAAQATIQSLKDKLVSTDAPSSQDGMVQSLQMEIESLHAQIKHLKDVLQCEDLTDTAEKSIQTHQLQLFNSFVQTDEGASDAKNVEALRKELDRLEGEVGKLSRKVEDQAIIIDAKDKVIEDFKLISVSSVGNEIRNYASSVGHVKELEEALNISRETANSLQDRLKAKEENLNQYRSLLADIRSQMTTATSRHVQEMRALQLTIYQQQQAFTRMKCTLSQPVKDTLNIEGTIKDQLTRIHELEDEVSELQHTLGNVASQLTAARSEAHRWRCTADARLKEVDILRESQTTEKIDELNILREKLKQQESKIADLEADNVRLRTAKDSITDIVNAFRNEQQHHPQQSPVPPHKTTKTKELQDSIAAKDKEISDLQVSNKQLQQKVSALQLRVSKMTAVNKHTGVSMEMEQLKGKYALLEEEKSKLENELKSLNKVRDVEEEKKRKAGESVARWEEAKKWKKTVEKLEAQIESVKKENEKLTQANKNLRTNIARLDKMLLDYKRLQPPAKSILKHSDDSVEVDKLKFEIQDLNELVERTEFEGREKIATLEMEIRCLKERIVSQERQLVAYQVAQKGDPKLVSEMEKMAGKEEDLQKAMTSLEEENLHLKLQIEQLRLDTPRLRDRVQQLQRLVDVLKSEKPEVISTRANSQKSLSELERTITALKQLIDKLQSENKKLRLKPVGKPTTSSENLRVSIESLLAEKKTLMDQLAVLEEEKKKYHKMYIEASSSLESVQIRLQDAERRAKSSDMKLRTFLESDEQSVYQRMKSLEEALERKTKLLDDAKLALRQAASNK